MNSLLNQAFDPAQFKAAGYGVIDLLTAYLTQQPERKVIEWKTPDEMAAFFENHSSSGPLQFLETVIQHSIQLHHPRYLGHQVSPSVPIAALAGLVSDLLNNGMGVYEMGAAATVLERYVIKTTAGVMGFTPAADGFLTSGGSLANLTALLAARAKKIPGSWQEGNMATRPALMVSEEAHYCVERAVKIMGWGQNGIIKVPSNENFQMDTRHLPPLLQKAKQEGTTVIAVVGSACSTAAGAFDDLEVIADFCRENDLWFHVDGAHGAACSFSNTYKNLVKGLNRADSVTMDFHKMLITPAVTTALVFREGSDAYGTFSQRAHYLWSQDQEEEWYNIAKRSFECTKLMMSVKVASIMQSYGLSLFEEYIDTVILNTALFAELLTEKGFELACWPSCNIICFRYNPKRALQEGQVNQLMENIRQQLLEDGTFYIVKTSLHQKTWLRCTLTNPFTQRQDMEQLANRIIECAGG